MSTLQSRATGLIFLLAFLLACPGEHCRAEEVTPGGSTYNNLQAVARIMSAAAPKRIVISKQSLYINLNPTPFASLISKPDRFTLALELMVRIQRIRADLVQQLPNETFWIHPVEEIEKIPPQLVEAASRSSSEDALQSSRLNFEQQAQANFDRLETALEAYAKGARLDVLKPRGPAQGYEVSIHTGSQPVRVRYMSLGEYEYCKRFKLDMTDRWRDLGRKAILIGTYHYIADLPQGKVEGSFEVTSNNQVELNLMGNQVENK